MLIIPIFVPHAGCPHDCCFCDQKKISGHKAPPTESEIIKTTANKTANIRPKYIKNFFKAFIITFLLNFILFQLLL